ncbi:MAG: hypothetical protein Fur0035_21470 [Anaerolineales bacterium]
MFAMQTHGACGVLFWLGMIYWEKYMPDEMVIFTRAYDFVSWLLPLSASFPKNQRFTVTARLQNSVLNL